MGIAERKEREKERRRQQILVAAKRVFSLKGFNRSTMEDIAKEAEFSPGTLYLYFNNKDELFTSLSLKTLQYLNLRLRHVQDNAELNPLEKFLSLKEVMIDVYEFDPWILIHIFHLQSNEILKNLSEDLLNEITHLSRSTLGIMADIFKEGIEQGYFHGYHPFALADIYWSIFSGVVLWEESKRSINPRKNFLRPTLELAFQLFEQGVIKKAPPAE